MGLYTGKDTLLHMYLHTVSNYAMSLHVHEKESSKVNKVLNNNKREFWSRTVSQKILY